MHQPNIDRAELADAYAHQLLDGMSGRALERFFLNTIAEMLDNLSLAELIQEVKDTCPELLEVNQ